MKRIKDVKRITIIFTKAEYEAIKEEAGDVPLTRWIRRLTLPVSILTKTQLKNLEKNTPFEELTGRVPANKAVPPTMNFDSGAGTGSKFNSDAKRAAPVDMSKILP